MSNTSHNLPAPKDLPTTSFQPDPFDPLWLPIGIREWVVDTTERMGAPIDYVAVSAMVCAGAAVGSRVGIRPKAHDDWTVVPNLWGLLIGEPGSKKSPAMKNALRPIQKLESQAASENRTARRAFKKEKNDDGASQVEPPVQKRFVVNDATTEKLNEICRDNPEGVLFVRDEFAGWLESLSKSGREGQRQFFLEAWAGDNAYTEDRIGRGTVRSANLCLSILGSIQPGVLQAQLRSTLADGNPSDGLMQRFQLAVWPQRRSFDYVDRSPNRKAAESVFRTLGQLSKTKFFGKDIGDIKSFETSQRVHYRKFSAGAQELFREWYIALQNRMHDEPAAFAAHLSKYGSLLPSLALIHHLLSQREEVEVGVKSFQAAKGWVAYLASHARRIYAPALKSKADKVRRLGEHVRNGDLESGFTVRDVYRKGWKGLSSRAEAATAVGKLVELDWLTERHVNKDGNGRPTVRYKIHSALRT